MLIIISPAKIQNFKKETLSNKFTQPEFIAQAQYLVDLMRELSPQELTKLLEINNSLTQLNFDRFFNWHLPFTIENAKQTVFAFDGEVFRGLNAREFSESDYDYAQSHLRILSGLYGILKPLDLIQAYRLDVSSKLQNSHGNNLYSYWKEIVTSTILRDLKVSGEPQVILNLASSEYIKTLDSKNKQIKIIDIEFYEYINDKYKQIVIYTKKARGLMARYVIQNRIENIEDLKGFSEEGYWFSPQMSTNTKLVFTR